MITSIIDWHKNKFPNADKWAVYRKTLEEIGELAEAMSKDNRKDLELEFGDVMVCLISLSYKLDLDIMESAKKAHHKNINR